MTSPRSGMSAACQNVKVKLLPFNGKRVHKIASERLKEIRIWVTNHAAYLFRPHDRSRSWRIQSWALEHDRHAPFFNNRNSNNRDCCLFISWKKNTTSQAVPFTRRIRLAIMLLRQITPTEVAVITRLEPLRDDRQRFESFLFLFFPVELAKGLTFLGVEV